jgi:hypothetical protein
MVSHEHTSMNLDDEQIFDPISELSRLENALSYHLPERVWFHASKALSILESVAIGPWVVAPLRSNNGCVFEAVGCRHLFQIRAVNLRQTIFVSAVARPGLDSVVPRHTCCIFLFKGRDRAHSWLSILSYATQMEDAAIWLPGWVDELRQQWAEYERLRLARIIPRYHPNKS